jgi:hypothetical protein
MPRLPLPVRWLALRAAVRQMFGYGHVYLSTGCAHDRHDYCQGETGAVGAKTPAVCKFCLAACVCPCHR